MRHRVKSVKLNRKKAPLKALLRGLITSLVLHERIKTTQSKAKAIQPLVGKMIATAKKKENKREAIRSVMKIVFEKQASEKVINDLLERYKDRPSGFTRIIPIGVREGDGSPLVQIELLA